MTAYSAEVLADTPLLYWRLNEATPGTGTAADSSGNSRNGTYVASPTSVAGLLTAEPDAAVTFNGSSQWVTSTYNPFATASSRTFECWVKRTNQTTADVIWGGSQASTQPFLRADISADTISFFTSAAAAGQTYAAPTIGTVATHVVLTFVGGTKVSELYINGVSKGTKTHSTDFDATPGNFNLCKRSASSDPFLGVVDEVAIYGTILSVARIKAHYAAGFRHGPPGRRPASSVSADTHTAVYR